MRINSLLARVALAATLATVSCLVCVSLTSTVRAQSEKSGQPNISSGEQTLLKGINSAPNPAAKLKAAAELIKKYPKSSARPRVASEIAYQIAGVANATEKISLAQEYQHVFTEPSEKEFIVPVLVEAFAGANRFDEAFSAGAAFLAPNPDALRVLLVLMSLGTDQAKAGNTKFLEPSIQYGGHAVELFEANKKPAEMDEAGWTQYKAAVLPGVYRSLGILNLVKGDRAAAKVQVLKAVGGAPSDPYNYLLLATILYDEYQDVAKRYQNLPESKSKNDELQKVLAALDSLIDADAHLIALSEGVAPLQAARQQVMQDLESYYKYRHKSTDGMQQLIDKYKAAAKP
jgi:hypothetical protein